MSEQKELEDVLFSTDTKLEKSMTGIGFDKKDLLGETVKVQITGLGMNRWGKNMLLCVLAGEDVQLPISKANKNTLIDMLGSSLGDWIGKEVTVEGVQWTGEIDGEKRTGVQLEFS